MALILTGNSSSLTVDSTSGITFPNATIQAVAAQTGPAFNAYRGSTNQSISANTWTKVQLNTETFDTNNNFDSTTNYRFTPTVAGYYQINGSILFSLSSGTATATLTSIWKNGAEYATNECTATVPNGHSTPISTLMYMNGSTDYVELYGYCSSASASYTAGQATSFMNGFLARVYP